MLCLFCISVRVIIFSIIWILTLGKHHFWIFPNLTEDVGVIESFRPLYKHDIYPPPEVEKEMEKQKSKEKEDKEEEEEDLEEEDKNDGFELVTSKSDEDERTGAESDPAEEK